MNQILVAELLAEDALLVEIAAELKLAVDSGDPVKIEKVATRQLKHQNLRNLIIAEMSKPELALYELQRDHSSSALLSAVRSSDGPFRRSQ